jgi:hypothetical protein
MKQPDERSGPWSWWGVVVFAVVLASEVVWYPELASFVSRVILKQGDAGFEILYYRDVYVLPGAVALGVVVAVAAIAVRHSRQRLFVVLLSAWTVDAVLVCLSLWRYFSGLAAAERYRGI